MVFSLYFVWFFANMLSDRVKVSKQDYPTEGRDKNEPDIII
jgi:hypothetical protein